MMALLTDYKKAASRLLPREGGVYCLVPAAIQPPHDIDEQAGECRY